MCLTEVNSDVSNDSKTNLDLFSVFKQILDEASALIKPHRPEYKEDYELAAKYALKLFFSPFFKSFNEFFDEKERKRYLDS